MNADQKIIKNKVGLLNLSEVLGSVSEACKVMGYSRDSFYRSSVITSKPAIRNHFKTGQRR
jgi:hypothetical protein